MDNEFDTSNCFEPSGSTDECKYISGLTDEGRELLCRISNTITKPRGKYLIMELMYTDVSCVGEELKEAVFGKDLSTHNFHSAISHMDDWGVDLQKHGDRYELSINENLFNHYKSLYELPLVDENVMARSVNKQYIAREILPFVKDPGIRHILTAVINQGYDLVYNDILDVIKDTTISPSDFTSIVAQMNYMGIVVDFPDNIATLFTNREVFALWKKDHC